MAKLNWFGGNSYAIDPTNLDTVDDLGDAEDLCESRYYNRDGRTPAVSYDSMNDVAGWVYLDDSIEDATDVYPDHIILASWHGEDGDEIKFEAYPA